LDEGDPKNIVKMLLMQMQIWRKSVRLGNENVSIAHAPSLPQCETTFTKIIECVKIYAGSLNSTIISSLAAIIISRFKQAAFKIAGQIHQAPICKVFGAGLGRLQFFRLLPVA